LSPAQFISRVKKSEIPPVSLFLGQEGYYRARCREALTAGLKLEPEIHDAATMSLAAIIDDANAMSLFARERLIFVVNAEAAMPRSTRSAAPEEDSEGEESAPGDISLLEKYVSNPVPGVTLIFEATRWDFEGEDKTKLERARKFYGVIKEVVEFRSFSPADARMELDRIAKSLNVRIDPAASEALVEALAADVGRIAVELEKLSLYGKPVTVDDLPLLVPDARQSTIFVLVNALGRRDRARALDVLDALVREGEYLPLALTFLAGQFRMALVAREVGLKSAPQVQAHFTKQGIPMWGSRADQVWATASKFSKEQLERGLKLIFEADRDLRSARPDDRTIVENFVMRLCA
jgi:DNA polymerase-3 subunit delta